MMIIGINNRIEANFILKCIMCSAAITFAEFVTGMIVNVGLKWDIWDYKDMEFNLLGQICPAYSVLWAVISAPIMLIYNMVKF